MGSTPNQIAGWEQKVREGKMSMKEYQTKTRAKGYTPAKTRRALG